MASAAIQIIYSIVQLDGFVPVVDVRCSVKTVVTCGFGRIFVVRLCCTFFHIELGTQLGLRYIVEIIVRAEGVVRVIVCSQFGSAVRLCIRVILACHVVGDKIYNNFQSGTVSAMYQILELLHSFRHIGCQVRIYIIIILDGVGRARFAFHDGGVVGPYVEATVIRLRCMLDNACIPDMGSTQFLDFSKCFEGEVGHFTTSVGGNVSIVDTMVVIVSKQACKHLIDNHFIFVVHIE